MGTQPTEMLKEVLEREEGIADTGLRPVQKDTAFPRNENVAWIKIEVTEGVWNIAFLHLLEMTFDFCAERDKLCVREGRRGSFCLPIHQLAHGQNERIDKADERANPYVPASRFKEMQTFAKRLKLQRCKALGRPCPGI